MLGLGLGLWDTARGSHGDPLAPAAPTLDLQAASDTGSSSTDNITSDTTPDIDFITSIAVVENDVLKIFDNGVQIVSHTVSAGEAGSSTIALGLSALSEGTHSLTATHTIAGPHTSTSSSPLTLIIDTTAPTLTSPTGTKTGDTTADISVSTNEATGTLYWVVDQNLSTPSAAQIKAGQDQGGGAADRSGNVAVSSTGTKTVNVTGLTGSTTYKAYFAHEDAAGNISGASASSSFTTDAPTEDAATTAWVNAVVSAGGSVSSGRRTLVNTLISGLKTDGVFAKLDRLWVFAAENTQSALVSMATGNNLATAIGSPTFTTDRGYSGMTTANMIETNFNASTAGGLYTQNAAHISCWDNIGAGNIGDGGRVVSVNNANLAEGLHARFTSGSAFFRVNASGSAGVATADANGFYIGNRSASNAWQGYKNGSSITSGADASEALINASFGFPNRAPGQPTTADPLLGGSFGGSLTAGDASNFFTRLQTYFQALGAVP